MYIMYSIWNWKYCSDLDVLQAQKILFCNQPNKQMQMLRAREADTELKQTDKWMDGGTMY
jgi:hypothetical protein